MEDLDKMQHIEDHKDYPPLSPDITATPQASLTGNEDVMIKEEFTSHINSESPRRMTRSQSLDNKQKSEQVDISKKKEQIKKEITSIWNGTHPKLVQQKRSLQKHQEEKVLLAESWKTYQLGIIEKLYQQERIAAEKEFETQRNQIRERMIQELLERKRKWLEEHHDTIVTLSQQVDPLSSINWMEEAIGTSNGKSTNISIQRKLRKRNQGASATSGTTISTTGLGSDSQPPRASERISGMKSKKGLSGPTIVASLKEFEIDEDLDIIRQKKNDGMATRRYKYSNTKITDQKMRKLKNNRGQDIDDEEIQEPRRSRNTVRNSEKEDMDEETPNEDDDDVYDGTLNISS